MIPKPHHSILRAGDTVAVTSYKEFPDQVVEIATIQESDPFFITLSDGRTYSARDGLGFGRAMSTRIRRATVRDETTLAVTRN